MEISHGRAAERYDAAIQPQSTDGPGAGRRIYIVPNSDSTSLLLAAHNNSLLSDSAGPAFCAKTMIGNHCEWTAFRFHF